MARVFPYCTPALRVGDGDLRRTEERDRVLAFRARVADVTDLAGRPGAALAAAEFDPELAREPAVSVGEDRDLVGADTRVGGDDPMSLRALFDRQLRLR